MSWTSWSDNHANTRTRAKIMEKKRNKCDAAIRQAIIDCLEKHLSNTDIQTAYPGILQAIKEWVWECELPAIDGKGTSTYQDVLDSLRTYFKDGFEEDSWWNSTHVLWALKNVLVAPNGDAGANVGNAGLISRQDAIDAARHAWAKGLEPTQFLEELPPAQPDVPDTNVGDMIYRQQAIDAIGNVPDHDDVMVWEALFHAQRDVALLPSAQPEKHTEERTETHACDLISRAMLLEYINNEPVGKMLCDKYNLDGVIKQLPSAQPEPSDAVYRLYKRAYEAGLRNAQPELHFDEWCTDCKEYDHERHRCPRWNRVIRGTLKDAQPDIIRCKDCKHYQFADNRAFGMPVKMCEWFGFEDVDDDDFCSRAERRKK